jgi:hypothetical protein
MLIIAALARAIDFFIISSSLAGCGYLDRTYVDAPRNPLGSFGKIDEPSGCP